MIAETSSLVKAVRNSLFCRSLLGFLSLIGCLSSTPLQAQTSDGGIRQVFDFADTVVDYQDYPFPVVEEGELWVPDLTHQTVTAFVPVNWDYGISPTAKSVLDQAIALRNSNQGIQANELLSQNRAILPPGKADLEIGLNYFDGRGGVTMDKDAGLVLIKRAALNIAQLYLFLGNQEQDQQRRLHTWSVGLSRGCQPCARSLIMEPVRPPETDAERRFPGNYISDNAALPPELRLAYALVAVDLGADGAPEMLADLVRRQIQNPKPVPDWVTEMFEQMWQDMRRGVNGNRSLAKAYTVPTPTYRRVRTGLVDGRLQLAALAMDRQDWSKAAEILVFERFGGRYYPQAVNALMERMPGNPVVVGPAGIRTLAINAAKWGDTQHAAAAALTWAKGYPILKYIYNKWQPHGLILPDQAEQMRALAESFGQLPREVASLVSRSGNQLSPAETAAQAAACLRQANRSGSVETWLGCRSVTYQAWSGTNEVDFGILSDQLFVNLSQMATNAYQAEYDRRVRIGADAITSAQARRENPRSDFSNTRITAAGELQRRNEEFARLNRQNFQNIPSFYDAVQEWRRAFERRRASLLSGADQADAARSRTCALWSLQVMPLCE